MSCLCPCSDGIQNGSETGVDCGGTCPSCGPVSGNVQVTTISGHYFETNWDNWLDGGIDCSRYSGTQSPEAVSSIRLRDDEAEFSAMTSPTYDLTQYDSVKVEFKFRTSSMESGEDFWIRYYNGTIWTTVKTYVFNTDFNNEQIYTKTVKIVGPLSNTSKFKFQSDAGDNTDLVYIDAVIIRAFKTVAGPTCSDGIQNGSETGVDCGGTCVACPSCSDGLQNGTETGVDCGGSCAACPTCTDGTQNGSETGVDCGGSCPPCSTGGNSTLLSGHYFEVGWDEWIDGGGDCFRYQGPLSPEGQYSIRIRDNEGDFSSMTSPAYNLTPYNSVQVEFKFKAVSMEAGKDFWLQYYNGTSWITKATFVSGTNFNNDIVYMVTVNITGPLSNAAKFKIMCDADSNEDIVYIDAVVIRGTSGSSLIESVMDIVPLKEDGNPLLGALTSGIRVFPNPANDLLHIQVDEDILYLNIYNISGQLISRIKSGNQNQTIDVSDFKEGIYIIKIETEENIYTEKFIKK
ncbi:MAG: T9SS type A sorting domain-containing protein [Saprospiraceae bacterium]|nr:T9SS type A sorting domain-containing protein [Saprospiraceae bacterium]